MNVKTVIPKSEKLFFAYQGTQCGTCDNNVDSIKRAISDFNSHQKTISALTWEDLKKSGSYINKEILYHIKESIYFACDLTHLNHNVLFELGYAIALNKNIFIFLNEEIEDAKDNYQNFFLKNIKYTSFKNSKDILSKLQNKEFSNEHIKNAIPNDKLNEENDIFYLENDSETQATIDLNEYISSLSNCDKKLKVKLNDPYEVEYKTLSYYFLNLHKAKSVIFHMLPTNYDNAFFENGKNSFLAGIACGLGKQVLLIAPAKFKSPLDYADILITYTSSQDCIDRTNQWITTHCLKRNNYNEILEVNKDNISNINILKIALECTAENEKEDLSNYFIPTNAYEKAKENKSKLLLIGRKGAGKTAIYYKLIEDFSDNPKNYNINLKPDSLELLENIDFSSLYKSQSSKKTFFYTVWKTVIYSKLIQVIKTRIVEKSTQKCIISEEENEILDFCTQNEELIKQNFFGIIKSLSVKLSEHTIESPKILEDLHINYLRPLTNLLKKYFENMKYIKLNILSDNLDKSWNPQSNLELQSSMILTLLEVDSQIKNELSNERKDNIMVLNYIFLREDIYNYIFKEANEPDKLRTISFKINWEDSPLKLKELVELKLSHILSKDNEDSPENIWDDLFVQIDKNKSVFDIIKDIIILRPRDIIFFIQALFESAANNNRNKVSINDFEYAVNQYTEFLNGNLIAEMKAEYPKVQDVLKIFQLYKIIKYKDYISKLKSQIGYNSTQSQRLTEALFKNGYLTAIDKTAKMYCRTYKELETALSKKKFFIFKHNIYLFVNNRYICDSRNNKSLIKKLTL